MKNNRTGVLLVNLGTPDSPRVKDVRKYLREFLTDPRVIDIPAFNRYLLVNGIIAPFRAPKSAATYQKLWQETGSPLMHYGKVVRDRLQEMLGKSFTVSLGMRYQKPSIKESLEPFRQGGYEKIIVVPLFPQYASATTGSVHARIMEYIKTWEIIPELEFISNFPARPEIIKAFADQGRAYMEQDNFDHILFSYHGLPERQIKKGSVDNYCRLGDCCKSYHQKNQYCYRAQCFETSRKLAEALSIKDENYTVCFQSRLGKSPWIKPYTDEVIDRLAEQGVKKVLVFAPSFVADCLETTIEIGEEYKEQFENNGGEKLEWVESLNDNEKWVEGIKNMVKERL